LLFSPDFDIVGRFRSVVFGGQVVPRDVMERQYPIDLTMRILLQHARTGLYLRGLGDWSANPFEATDFQHSQRAIDYARQHQIAGVQIAVRFLDSDYDEIAPLPALPQPTAASAVYS
jgi:hypothetical protein